MPKYIDAEKLKKSLCPYEDAGYAQDMETILSIVDEQPAADVEPVRHGRWMDTDRYGPHYMTIVGCSNCRAEIEGSMNDRYCPRCGAKMDLEETP